MRGRIRRGFTDSVGMVLEGMAGCEKWSGAGELRVRNARSSGAVSEDQRGCELRRERPILTPDRADRHPRSAPVRCAA